MSISINSDSLNIYNNNTQLRSKNMEVSTSEKKEAEAPVKVEISKDALKAQLFEKWKNEGVKGVGTFVKVGLRDYRKDTANNPWEAMRILAPDEFDESEKLLRKSREYEKGTEEYYKYRDSALKMRDDWFEANCFDSDGQYVDPFSRHRGIWMSLEARYTDAESGVAGVNFYNSNLSDSEQSVRANMWRFRTKYNLSLSTDQFNILANGSYEQKSKLLDLMDDAMNQIKKAGNEYRGDKEALCLCAKMHDNGTVTYHARYKGCENADGISAGSVKELFEMLNS